MGIIYSRFKRKPTPFQVLEQLETRISSIENFQQITEHRQKKIVGHLILYSVALYTVSALIFYFYFFPASLRDRLFYIIPLLIFPLIVVIVKKIVTWYYKRQILSNEEKLSNLKAEKKQVVDNVMAKETFNVATEILEKFAPDKLRKNALSSPLQKIQPVKPGTQTNVTKSEMRPVDTSLAIKLPGLPPAALPNVATNASNGGNFPQSIKLPRPILPKERTNIDKLVEFLVGDGPNNRYALICKICCSHNGMALSEEFLFIAFRCCYCGFMNPARKQRLRAPRLEIKITKPASAVELPTYESEKGKETEEETEERENVLNSEDEDNDTTEFEKYESEEDNIKSSDFEEETDTGDNLVKDDTSEATEKSEAEKKID